MSAPLLMLKELGTIHTGSTPKTSDDSLFGGDFPFVTPGDLDAISPIHSAPRTLTEAGVKTADLLPAESVLVCCIGSLGKIGFAGRPLVTNQQINAVVFNPLKVHARYGFFACRMLKPQLELMAPATTVPIVNKSRFSELRIPVPPLEDQRRIAAILDQAETLRTQRRAAQAQLDSLTQSIFLDMFGDPNRNDRGWTVVRLESLCDAIWDIDHKMPKAVEDGMPFISAKDLVENGQISFNDVKRISDEDFKHLSKKGLPRKGDIIYSRIGVNLGKARMVEVDFPFLASYSCCTIRSNEQQIDRQFLCHLLDSPFLLKQAQRGIRGIAVPDLGMGEIRNFQIVLPPLPLQQTFATRIQAIESLKATHRAALAELEALFASLQQRAFAGVL